MTISRYSQSMGWNAQELSSYASHSSNKSNDNPNKSLRFYGSYERSDLLSSSLLQPLDESNAPATSNDTMSFQTNIGLWEAFIGLVTYIILGVVVYSFILEKWSMVDSFYFSTVTFTTIGYGDLYPSTHMGRIFTCFFAFIGVAFIGICLGALSENLVGNELKAFEATQQNIMTALLTADDDHGFEEEQTNKIEFNYVKNLDTPRNRKEFFLSWLPFGATILITCTFVFLGAYIIGSREGWNWSEIIYFGIITSATIGYGDYTPKSQNRLFTGFYILFTTGVTSYFLGFIATSLVERKRRKVFEHFHSTKLQWKDLRIMDTDKDGKVSRSEYVEYMLTSMNIVDASLIQELHERFTVLDADGSGYLDQNDVILRSQRRVRSVKRSISGPECLRVVSGGV